MSQKCVLFLGNAASQTAWDIDGVFHSTVITQLALSKWFAKYRPGNSEHANEQHGRPALQAAVKSNLSECTHELLLMTVDSKQTLVIYLAQIG